jgi:hypothetical protein
MPGLSEYKDRNNVSTQNYEEVKLIHGVKKITDVFGRVINYIVFSLTVRNVLSTD